MMGKAIYMPNGAASEYAKYACNFYCGCSNSCVYCFNKRWGWGDVPTLKKCFKTESHALEVFEMELMANLPELQKHGFLLSFTTDPLLADCSDLTWEATMMAMEHDVPVKFLTKTVGVWTEQIIEHMHDSWKKFIAIGFTLTGRDELEPNASTNAERIKAMRKLHDAGFRVWCSAEPIINIKNTMDMIGKTYEFCDHYKIGILSGKRYDKDELQKFIVWCSGSNKPIYFKDSLLSQAGIRREDLSANCVDRNFKIWEL